MEMMMLDMETVCIGDQLMSAIQEVFAERGYDIVVDIDHTPEGMDENSVGYGMKLMSRDPIELTDELVEPILEEAVRRIGGIVKE
jgi:hypothetical protein